MRLFHGLVYGGSSSTFIGHKRILMGLIRHQQIGADAEANEANQESSREKADGKNEDSEEFHAWECISLLRKRSTLDLVVKDEVHLMALLHFTGRKLYY